MLYYKTYEHSTSAEWVTFVHGAGGSSSIWFKQIKSFKKHYNVLLLDLRGHGKSQEIFRRYFTNEYNFENIAKDILEVLDHLKIRKSHFVGISLGTILMRTLCEIAPQRVSSLVMGGAVTRLNIRSKVLVGVGNATKRIIPYMWLYKLFAWIIMPRKRNQESRILFANQAKKLCQKEFIRWFKLTYKLNPLLKYFNENDTRLPTLYLMGNEDYMFLPQVMDLVTKHSNAYLRVIPDCGHVCNVEQPDVFNRMAMEFIDSNSFKTTLN
ncbi:alpha/beta hydrolase [Roseivirga sp. UBA838]|jgi:pimeloyl-ACP methyl ester carboxylesterase|uniref:alpha/beta fold hydrolase n=1 Tax=Roseivirga sp. UBA838 TaxID=1947393 RepID=UPI0025807725|nr:alpha/beta hydrolase [Roseivirga sp. UBA838]|tara:strand:- start:48540 stop:49340 length:801 start_codon:yes stop_codon:yes gene_type:complete